MVPARERLDRPAAAAAELDERLEVRLDVATRDCPRSSPTSVRRATSASYMSAEKIAQRARPPALAAYIARSALRSSSPAEPHRAREGDADAGTYAHGPGAHAQRREQRGEHALGGALRLDDRGSVLEQDGELVAAQARSEVVLAQCRTQPLGDRDEQRVPSRVPERVVDALEVVEVEEHHSGSVVVARQRGLDTEGEQRRRDHPARRPGHHPVDDGHRPQGGRGGGPRPRRAQVHRLRAEPHRRRPRPRARPGALVPGDGLQPRQGPDRPLRRRRLRRAAGADRLRAGRDRLRLRRALARRAPSTARS